MSIIFVRLRRQASFAAVEVAKSESSGEGPMGSLLASSFPEDAKMGEKEKKEKTGKGKKTKRMKGRALGSTGDEDTDGIPPKTPKYLAVLHRATILCVVTYAVSCRIGFKLMHCPKEDVLAECHLLWIDEPSLMAATYALIALHVFAFPIFTAVAAAAVHMGAMGGSCCRDSEVTAAGQLSEARFPPRVMQWRYFLVSDVNDFHPQH